MFTRPQLFDGFLTCAIKLGIATIEFGQVVLRHTRPIALIFLVALAIAAGYVVVGPSPGLAAPNYAWVELLKGEQFDRLEADIQAADTAAGSDDCGECAIVKAYYEFATSDPLVGRRLDQWIATHPDSVPAHLARGLYREHLSALARGTAHVSATHPKQLAEMARLQSGALDDLTWVIKRNERSPAAYSSLIRIATTRADSATVARIYEQAIAANPGSPNIYRTRAWSLTPWWQGALPWSEALERQQAFVGSLRPSFAGQPGFEWLEGYEDYAHAEVLRQSGDSDGAIPIYTKALQARASARVLVARAQAYRNLGQYAQEVVDLERAFELDPANQEAQFRVAKYRAAQCREAVTKGADAVGICEAASALLDATVGSDPLQPDYLVARAAHLILIGNVDAARRDIDSAEIFGGYDAGVQDSIGEMLANIDPLAAKTAFRRAVEMAPHEIFYFSRYIDFLGFAGDCDFLAELPAYRAACHGDETCGLDSDDDEIASRFQNMRGRSCARETWREPQSSFVMPD